MKRDREGASSLSTGERMATLGKAAADAMGHSMQGEHETEHGVHYTVDLRVAEELIANWPAAPKEGAQQMLDTYGAPNEATPTKLFWYRKGPWKRIEATSDVLVHKFPSPHSDYLTQWIDYKVPIDKFDEIARYDGSCLVDRTAGEVGARCDSEAANNVTINYMHEIVTGRMSVEEARKAYADSIMAYTLGRPAPQAERLQFSPPRGGTEDPDEDMGMGPMVRQAGGKVKDMVTGRDDRSSQR